MQAVFNLPMTSVEGEQALWARLLGRQAGDQEDHLLVGFPGFDLLDAAFDACHLADMREVDIVVQQRARPDLSGLLPTMLFVIGLKNEVRGEKRPSRTTRRCLA